MKKSLFLFFACFLIFDLASAGFRVSRRRTPPCDSTPCSWTWGSCSASCGPGSQSAVITRQKGPCGACSLPSPRSCNVNCLNGGVIDSSSKKCMCGKYWEGTCCEEEVKCEDDESVCDMNAVCLNNECHCIPGFHGDGKSCADQDECTEGTHDCSTNAKCKNTVGAFECECSDGYSGDGLDCKDIDECLLETTPCHEMAACKNTDGSFECLCFPGYHGDGINCTQGCTKDELPKIDGEGFIEEEGIELFGIGAVVHLRCKEGHIATSATTATCTESGFVSEGSMICVYDCKDEYTQCARWQKQDYCNRISHKDFMNNFCEKSCKLC